MTSNCNETNKIARLWNVLAVGTPGRELACK